MTNSDTWDPDIHGQPVQEPYAPARPHPPLQQQNHSYAPSPPPLSGPAFQPRMPVAPAASSDVQRGLPWWAWAGFGLILVMVGMIGYVAVSALPSKPNAEPSVSTTSEESSDISEDLEEAEPTGDSGGTESIPTATSWIDGQLSWEDADRYQMGETISIDSDTQKWKLEVTGVDRDLGQSAPGTDLGQAPSGYSFVKVSIKLTNEKGDPASAWVSHIIELALDKNTIYSETACWRNCFASAQPDGSVTSGDLYYLVPDEDIDNELSLVVNPLYGSNPDFIVEIP